MKQNSANQPPKWASAAFLLFFLISFCAGLCLHYNEVRWWPMLPAGAVCLLSLIALYTDWIVHFLGAGDPLLDEHAKSLLEGKTFTIRKGKPVEEAPQHTRQMKSGSQPAKMKKSTTFKLL